MRNIFARQSWNMTSYFQFHFHFNEFLYFPLCFFNSSFHNCFSFKYLSQFHIPTSDTTYLPHLIETQLSASLSKEQRILFDNLDAKFTDKPFDKKENDILCANWEEFAKVIFM